MRTRLRPKYEDEAAFYLERYPAGYDHTVWPDHVERVEETVRWAVGSLTPVWPTVRTVADLSCGDGAVAMALAKRSLQGYPILGDVNGRALPGYGTVPSGDFIPLPASLDYLEPVDLYVCTETLEHLDDPDGFLLALRPKARFLLLTTPEGETTDGNPEHYWGWDAAAVGGMLGTAGWTVLAAQVFLPPYAQHSPDVIPTQMWIFS